MDENLRIDRAVSSCKSVKDLSLLILQEYERLIGEKGLLSLPSGRIALCQHGCSYVEKRGPT